MADLPPSVYVHLEPIDAQGPGPLSPSNLTDPISPISSFSRSDIQALSKSILKECKRILSHCKKVYGKDKAGKKRLRYLYSTTEELFEYVKVQSGNKYLVKDYNNYGELLTCMDNSIKDIARSILSILESVDYTADLDASFDIFELALSRYVAWARQEYPLRGHPFSRFMLIDDEKARQVWEEFVGDSPRRFFPMALFYARVILPAFSEEATKIGFKEMFCYFMTFPVSTTISAFSWNVMIRLFGPYDDLATNFVSIVMHTGFAGLVNRVTAEHIVISHATPCSYLLRSSRQHPTYMAITYLDHNLVCHHALNTDPQDIATATPLSTYLSTYLPNYVRVSYGLDLEAVKQFNQALTSCDAASTAYGRIYATLQDRNYGKVLS